MKKKRKDLFGRSKAKKFTAIYVRVSSNSQTTRSQMPDLKRYVAAQTGGQPVKWFIEKRTGRVMDRPQWNKLQAAINNNMVSRLVVWKLDRLGRTAPGMTKLFEELVARKVRFISTTENFDLGTTAGRLFANMLACFAAYETEVRGERVRAGQAASNKRWGGSEKGSLYKHTKEQVKQIVKMKKKGEKVSVICRTVGVDRQSIYRILKRVAEGSIEV